MPFFFAPAKNPPKQSPTRYGYHLANDTATRRTVPQYVPPMEDCPSSGTQWASENIAGIVTGGLGVLAAGMGLGYLIGAQNNPKKEPKQTALENNLQGYYHAHDTTRYAAGNRRSSQ